MPKNIVLLSDGTGNSAAKANKTNVWRIYQALDLADGTQLAFYDDGVGTEGFKWLRWLGGGVGWGLARNVRDLYEQLCRHYAKGDRIYLFGFSRGAFTARVLGGLITRCGILDRVPTKTICVWRWGRLRFEPVSLATDAGLKAGVREAYRSYRRRYPAPLARAGRFLRDLVIGSRRDAGQFLREYSVRPEPRITFIGVWDTVDAVGLPVDELSIAIHKYIYPHRFPDQVLANKVDTARHAVALDDERHTFHPVLWTEWHNGKNEPDDRPRQVWFAGVHSNLGGGYPDDRLSHVSLLWMIREAAAGDPATALPGLRFHPRAIKEYRAQRTMLGRLYDSRRGFAAYYRYKPRVLADLCQADDDGNGRFEVRIEKPKIHESVFRRIAETAASYAPGGLPAEYDVVTRSGQVIPADQAGYETAAQRAGRAQRQKALAVLVFWRRVFYFAMVLIAALLVGLPILIGPENGVVPEGRAADAVAAVAKALDASSLPFAGQIGRYWHQHSLWFFALAAAYAAAYATNGRLVGRAQAAAESAWAHLKGAGSAAAIAPPAQRPAETGRFVRGINAAYRWLTRKFMPPAALLLVLVVLFSWAGRQWLLLPSFGGASACKHVETAQPTAASPSGSLGVPFLFRTSEPCQGTGIEPRADREYSVLITVQEPWLDGTPELPADPLGLRRNIGWKEWFLMRLAAPARNFWTRDWFVLMGSIGTQRENAFRIAVTRQHDADGVVFHYRFRAWRDGRLHLFVNDAINACRWGWSCRALGNEQRCQQYGLAANDWRCFYANNKGSAEIVIREVGEN